MEAWSDQSSCRQIMRPVRLRRSSGWPWPTSTPRTVTQLSSQQGRWLWSSKLELQLVTVVPDTRVSPAMGEPSVYRDEEREILRRCAV